MSDDTHHHFHLTPTKRPSVRIGVRNEAAHLYSGVYSISSSRRRGNDFADVYIVSVGSGGAMKVSLHASGERHVGLTREHCVQKSLDPARRHYDQWGVDRSSPIVLEYLLRFPIEHLEEREPTTEDDRVHWIHAPGGPPSTLQIGVFLSTVPGDIELNFKNGLRPVYMERLADHRCLILAGRPIETGTFNNHDQLVAEVQKNLGTSEPPASYRVTVGFENEGVRGWADLSARRLLGFNTRDVAALGS